MSTTATKPLVQSVFGARPSKLTVTFPAQPAVNDTVTINGGTVKFIAAGATPAPGTNQVPLGADLASTVAALKTFLAASGASAFSALAYANAAGVLTISTKPGTSSADAAKVAVSASAATVSAPTLAGAKAGDAIDRAADVVELSTITGGAMTFALKDGVEGQLVTLVAKSLAAGANAVVSGSFGGGSYTFSANGQFARLQFLLGKWVTIVASGATLA